MANSNHACVNTKLLAMKSKMLGTQDYEALIKAPSLNDLFYYLKDNTITGHFWRRLTRTIFTAWNWKCPSPG